MKLISRSFSWCRLSLVLIMATIEPVTAQESNNFKRRLQSAINDRLDNINYQQAIKSKFSTSAKDLLAQNNLTRVTGVELNQTDDGLQVVLKTSAGGERLVPLILPEGNSLVIEILDTTLVNAIALARVKIAQLIDENDDIKAQIDKTIN